MKPNHDSDRVWLNHIRQCIEEVREYTGNQRETFDRSRLVTTCGRTPERQQAAPNGDRGAENETELSESVMTQRAWIGPRSCVGRSSGRCPTCAFGWRATPWTGREE